MPQVTQLHEYDFRMHNLLPPQSASFTTMRRTLPVTDETCQILLNERVCDVLVRGRREQVCRAIAIPGYAEGIDNQSEGNRDGGRDVGAGGAGGAGAQG